MTHRDDNRKGPAAPARRRGPVRIPILSFFTGAGLLDIGFMREGFASIWHNENDSWFADGFEYAMSSLTHDSHETTVQARGSICDLSPRTILRQSFGNLPRPDVFGVIGGPPCPDFSNGGRHEGRTGKHGQLSEVYIDRILEIQPTFFVFENVPGLYRFRKHRTFLDELQARLEQDYCTSVTLLNALMFGVPQDRSRMFLIGLRRRWMRHEFDVRIPLGDHSWFPWPTPAYPNAKHLKWPTQSPFGATPERPPGIPDELMVGPAICDVAANSALPNGTEAFHPYSDRFRTIDEGDASRKSFKRLHRWRYSPAAAYGNNEVHLHPTEPRRLTVREAMRVQTVPDEYALPTDMPLTHKFKTIGNGVPVKLAEAVARAVASALRGELVHEYVQPRSGPSRSGGVDAHADATTGRVV